MSEQPFNFYFAYVDGPGIAFDPTVHNVMDEDIFSFELRHDEGQTPTLSLTIKNPRIGLLNPGRKVWAYFSYQHESGIVPLFLGVLVGVPTNLFAELITLQFIARSETYIEDKQAVAETMKVAPYYDPIFLDEAHRDEPDAILEGWSSLWHVDRVTLETTASDILEGEDGLIVYTEADALYDSVALTLGEAPLTNVQVQGTVNWTQKYTGFIDGPSVNIQSYTGETFIEDWPKPGTTYNGGWTVEASFVNDVYLTQQTPMAHSSSTWTNTDTEADDCSTDTISNSADWPAILSPSPLAAIMTSNSNSGDCDPDADPPVNKPTNVHVTGMLVPLWAINASWTFRYDAHRDYDEICIMDVIANTQGILTSPTVQQNTELLTLTGANVGEPIITADAWSDFENQHVGLGEIIFPNDPTKPGGLSYQVCVQAGTAGATEPTFSDIPGTVTDDNTVVWASLGESPLTTQPNWTPASGVGLGEIICYEPVEFDPETGTLQSVPNASVFYLCTQAGTTNSQTTEITYTPAIVNNDEPIPTPQQFFYIAGPIFDTTPGDQISDGSVIWTSLGVSPSFMGIPIGGTANAITARSYFPTDRGQQSVQYMISRARARLRMRSRAVKVAWDCPFDLAIGLSCRHSAQVFDPRLPGGQATGKVISYTMSSDGGTGKIIGHVEVGCAIGFGGQVTSVPGTPEYTAASGYMQAGYQRFDGAEIITDPDIEDISYSPPFFTGFDDGLSFPLTQLPGEGGVSGNSTEQAAAIKAAFPASALLANIGTLFDTQTTQNSSSSIDALTPSAAWIQVEQQRYWTARAVPFVMESHPVSYELTIQPVTNGPFSGAYTVSVSPLEIPQGINLEAPSSP